MTGDKSILLRMDEQGVTAPRVELRGTERSEQAATRYDILGEIARGGVGVVLRGHDNDIGRDVALKVLHDKHLGSPDLVQRFVEEAQIGGQLQHPGIVPVYELGLQSDDRPFFAMKLVKGETLAASLAARKGPSDERRALLAVLRDVCRAVAYAHTRGVIHRDLKPGNIMIGSFGEVQVVDWGFAKVLRRGGIDDEGLAGRRQRDQTMVSTVRSGDGTAQSIAGSVMGTPAYMPPEQALGRVEDLNEKSDIFSLGAILCEILTGEPPYSGSADERMTAAAHARLEPAYARLAACGADQRLVSLCQECLQPLPKDRPARAQNLADEIAGYLKDAEGRAHHARLRAIKAEAKAAEQRSARRQTILVGGGVLAALVIAAGAYFFHDAQRTRRANGRRAAIEAALQDASRLRAAEEWPLALAAAERAIQLGHEGEVVEAIRTEAAEATARAEREAEDDAFLAELEEIRGRRGQVLLGGDGLAAAEVQDDEATDAAYAVAFERRFGSLDASAERLAASRHAPAFAANLGFWCWIRKVQLKAPEWEGIDRLARRIDRDHEDLRDALISGDAERLLAIVEEQRGDLPLALAAPIGAVLTESGPEMAEATVAFLERQHQRAPGDFWINLRLSLVASKVRKFDLAARHATAAVAVQPRSAVAWNRLGNTLIGQGDLEGALVAYRHAIDLDPESAMAHYNLGCALWRWGDPEGALEAYRRSFDLDLGYAPAYANFGAELVKKGDYEGALIACRRAVELDPDLTVAHVNLGAALRGTGDLDGAIHALRRAFELAPGLQWVRVPLALLEMQKELEPQLALAIEGASVDVTPEERAVLGWMLQVERRYDLAVAMYAQAFHEDEALATEFIAWHQYNAACAAALAGNDSHIQALVWLHGDLEAVEGFLETNPRFVVRRLAHWKQDPDLASLRDREGLADEFKQLWADVDALLQRAEESSAR